MSAPGRSPWRIPTARRPGGYSTIPPGFFSAYTRVWAVSPVPPCSSRCLAALVSPAAAQVNEYEMRYGGQMIEVSVDNLLQMPESYVGRAVRTRGQLEMVPGRTDVRYALRGTFGGYL